MSLISNEMMTSLTLMNILITSAGLLNKLGDYHNGLAEKDFLISPKRSN